MFKNREFRVRLAKTDPIEDVSDFECTHAHIDAAEIHNLLTHQVKHVALAVGAVFVVKQLSLSAREIAFLAASKKFS